MPATLATEGIVVNYDVVASLIVVKPHDVVSVRSDPPRKVLEEVKKITNKICMLNMAKRIVGFRGYAMGFSTLLEI
ncbi:862_t:CDS:2 [Ambispora gerdemannii]|uniref:862_t:CDS:1 n=1 Tax=Ambispora gerdemannii TaxID=144530 RepID=A0A9N9EK74_9GLOM|nr:862_t:CDS:2 [Ambispora gerdemannii]